MRLLSSILTPIKLLCCVEKTPGGIFLSTDAHQPWFRSSGPGLPRPRAPHLLTFCALIVTTVLRAASSLEPAVKWRVGYQAWRGADKDVVPHHHRIVTCSSHHEFRFIGVGGNMIEHESLLKKPSRLLFSLLLVGIEK